MTDSIYVTLSSFAEYDRGPLDRLRDSGVPYTINPTGKRVSTPQLLEEGKDATAVIAGVEPYDEATLAKLPALRCISRVGVGVDAIDLAAARARGIAVFNTPDVPALAVAELTLAMMLALCRQLPRQSDLVRRREWTRLETHLLTGRTVGLVGFGRIGRKVAELLRPFHVTLLAADPHVTEADAASHGIELVPLDTLLARADIVSLHASSLAGSRFALALNELQMMKRGAVLINVARGTMVDEAALAGVLQSGHLAGAAMDVFPQEPYAGPLCDLPNVILTPHSATMTVETRVAMESQAVSHALDFLSGRAGDVHRVI